MIFRNFMAAIKTYTLRGYKMKTINVLSAVLFISFAIGCNKEQSSTPQFGAGLDNGFVTDTSEDETAGLYGQQNRRLESDPLYYLVEDGSSEALEKLLWTFFYGYYDDEGVDPIRLLSLADALLARNPTLKMAEDSLYYEYYTALKQAAEAGLLDYKKFNSDYNISSELWWDEPYYPIWELAEEASRPGGRFNGPNMLLSLQLVACAGGVPAETVSALDELYRAWKSGVPREFNIDEHITSGMGGNWVTARNMKSLEAQELVNFEALVARVPAPARALLRSENEAFNAFLELKVWNEEGHDGSGWFTWGMDSLKKQQADHFLLLGKIIRGEWIITQQPDNEWELQKAYDELVVFVKGRYINKPPFMHFSTDTQSIRETELAWIKYRDAFIALLKVLRPEISSDNVRRFLNTRRIGNLTGVLEFCRMMI